MICLTELTSEFSHHNSDWLFPVDSLLLVTHQPSWFLATPPTIRYLGPDRDPTEDNNHNKTIRAPPKLREHRQTSDRATTGINTPEQWFLQETEIVIFLRVHHERAKDSDTSTSPVLTLSIIYR